MLIPQSDGRNWDSHTCCLPEVMDDGHYYCMWLNNLNLQWQKVNYSGTYSEKVHHPWLLANKTSSHPCFCGGKCFLSVSRYTCIAIYFLQYIFRTELKAKMIVPHFLPQFPIRPNYNRMHFIHFPYLPGQCRVMGVHSRCQKQCRK